MGHFRVGHWIGIKIPSAQSNRRIVENISRIRQSLLVTRAGWRAALALLSKRRVGYGCARFFFLLRRRMSQRMSRDRPCLAVVLAAGEGTRMRSSLPKALHPVAGRTLIAHVLMAAQNAGCGEVAVVIGPAQDAVAADVKRTAPDARIVEQSERLGTAHAVLAARAVIEGTAGDLLVMFADTPLVRPETLGRLSGALDGGAAVAVLGFRPADPNGYGRLVTQGGELVAIREDRDANAEERAIGLCNAGLMALAGKHALDFARSHR